MAAERTIVIIGEKGRFCPALAEKLAQQNLHLLFISNDEEQKVQLQKQFKNKKHVAEIEFIHCEKEGCWEADIIALTQPDKIDPQLIRRIKNVATQKLVLIISEEYNIKSNEHNFKELLPNSRVVDLIINADSLEVKISSEDKDAEILVKGYFNELNYLVN